MKATSKIINVCKVFVSKLAIKCSQVLNGEDFKISENPSISLTAIVKKGIPRYIAHHTYATLCPVATKAESLHMSGEATRLITPNINERT